MTNPNESVEDLRDRHALILERFNLGLDRIDPSGGVPGLDSHQVTARDLELLGQRMTTVGVGLTDASVVRLHAEGTPALTDEQRQRAAVLHTVASLLEEIYEDSGETARAGLRSEGIVLEDGTETAPALVIADSPNGRSPLLHDWMAKMLPQVIGDPYYRQYRS